MRRLLMLLTTWLALRDVDAAPERSQPREPIDLEHEGPALMYLIFLGGATLLVIAGIAVALGRLAGERSADMATSLIVLGGLGMAVGVAWGAVLGATVDRDDV